jgi:hypothetical protein
MMEECEQNSVLAPTDYIKIKEFQKNKVQETKRKKDKAAP